jgi:hypothetical protein
VSNDTRDLLSRMADELDHYRQLLSDDRREVHAMAVEARAALAAEPVGEGPGCEGAPAASNSPCAVCGRPAAPPPPEVVEMVMRLHEINRPAAPPAPEPGEVEELLAANGVFKGSHGIEGLLNADAFWEQQPYGTRLYYGDGIADYLHRGVLRSASTLLQQFSAPAPVVVPVAVADALIKAECALSDVAEGEPECDEGDPAQWAEQRCAETLAVIRPVMKQHRIRTSEWPPQPLPQAGEGEGPNA